MFSDDEFVAMIAAGIAGGSRAQNATTEEIAGRAWEIMDDIWAIQEKRLAKKAEEIPPGSSFLSASAMAVGADKLALRYL